MDSPSAEQRVEAYRDLFKKKTKQSDKAFDKLVKSFASPSQALSYLKGRLNTR